MSAIFKPYQQQKSFFHIESSHKNQIWTSDLVFFKADRGMICYMPILDIYSRYCLSCYKVNNKKAEEILSAFTTTTRNNGYPEYFWTDEGKEFKNKLMQEYYDKHNIKLYHTHGPAKAAIAERFNLTLRRYVYMQIASSGKFNVQEIVDEYNDSIHSITGQKPIDIYKGNAKPIEKRETNKVEEMKFKPGDTVRILLKRSKFDKKSKHNWSEEKFTIKTSIFKNNIYGYYLDGIDGVFYTNELQLV